MTTIYCKKCGFRGNSKCPHCRSIFTRYPNPDRTDEGYLKSTVLEYFETFMGVQKIDKEDGEDGNARYQVTFWTYAKSYDEAIAKVLRSLTGYIPRIEGMEKVLACVHEWDIMPGLKSEIGCGHAGPPAGTEIPPDPFA